MLLDITRDQYKRQGQTSIHIAPRDNPANCDTASIDTIAIVAYPCDRIGDARIYPSRSQKDCKVGESMTLRNGQDKKPNNRDAGHCDVEKSSLLVLVRKPTN